MNIIVVYSFENNANSKVLRDILERSHGEILLQSPQTFCYDCESEHIFDLCLETYTVFNELKVLGLEDIIEFFNVNEIETGITIIRLKKKGNKKINKLAFEHLDKRQFA